MMIEVHSSAVVKVVMYSNSNRLIINFNIYKLASRRLCRMAHGSWTLSFKLTIHMRNSLQTG